MKDSTPQRLVLQAADGTTGPDIRVFDAVGGMVGTATSLSVVPNGGYVLVGDPPGEINNSLTVSLFAGAEIDSVDFGGDAPALNAGGVGNEAGARVPDGTDTGVGADDFVQQRATLSSRAIQVRHSSARPKRRASPLLRSTTRLSLSLPPLSAASRAATGSC